MTNIQHAQPRRGMAAAAAEPEPTVGLGLAAAVCFGLSLLYFLPALLPGRHIFGTDYLAGGYFSYSFNSARFAAGELPKWLPHLFGGYPVFANPGSTYYPVWVLLDTLLPVSRLLPALFVVQFGVAGVGMYLLARELGCRTWVAMVAGLAWQFTGITNSWVYAGHDGRIIVATMAPLLFFFLHRGVRTGRVAPFAGAAATVGFALLSFQIQNAYYLLLAAGIWTVFLLVHHGFARRPGGLGKRAGLALAAVAFGFVMAAVNFLPFRDYVASSPRGEGEGRGYEYATSYSMAPGDLRGLAVPEQVGASVTADDGAPLLPPYTGPNGFKLHTEYVGGTVMVLLAIGLLVARRDRRWWFFAGLGLFATTMALGGNTPLYLLYYNLLPGLSRFRAPDLAFYVLAFSLVAMAAIALERIAQARAAAAPSSLRKDADPSPARDVLWAVAAVVVVGVLGAAAAGAGAGDVGPRALTAGQGWMRFTLFAAAAGGAIWLWTTRRMGATAALAALSLVTVLDLWIIDRKFFQTVEPPEAMFAGDDVVDFLRSRPGPARVWVPPLPFDVPRYRQPNYLMHHGFDQLGGEAGNQLQRFNEVLGAGKEVYVDWHNLMRDFRVVEGPEGQAVSFTGNPRFLDLLNVRYVVTTAPLAVQGLREVHRGSALVYENATALPRAFLVPQAVRVPADRTLSFITTPGWDPQRVAAVEAERDLGLPATPLQGNATVTEHGPDRVVIQTTANRPALLVVTDNIYEGWRATVDGQETDVYRTDHTFRGVVVPAGSHRVVMTFRPGDLYTGLYVSLAAFALLAGYGIFLLVRRRRRMAETPAEPAAG